MLMTTATAVKKPKRIQRKRTKGFRMPNAVYVGRPSFWGNPYTIEGFGDKALQLYRNTALGVWQPSLLLPNVEALNKAYDLHLGWRARSGNILWPDIRRLLRGKDLACWCPLDQPCHADILLELANQ